MPGKAVNWISERAGPFSYRGPKAAPGPRPLRAVPLCSHFSLVRTLIKGNILWVKKRLLIHWKMTCIFSTKLQNDLYFEKYGLYFMTFKKICVLLPLIMRNTASIADSVGCEKLLKMHFSLSSMIVYALLIVEVSMHGKVHVSPDITYKLENKSWLAQRFYWLGLGLKHCSVWCSHWQIRSGV